MTTIRDVAAKAGVHPSTVSRTFSGKARISSSTCQRVLAAAECLGFQPHAIARSLSVRRTNTIGVVVPHIFPGYFEDSFFPQMMQGLLSAAYARDYRILVSGSNGHADEVTQTCQMLSSWQVDGIVALSSRFDVDIVGELQCQTAPFVMPRRPLDHANGVNWVDADNEQDTGRVRHI